MEGKEEGKRNEWMWMEIESFSISVLHSITTYPNMIEKKNHHNHDDHTHIGQSWMEWRKDEKRKKERKDLGT